MDLCGLPQLAPFCHVAGAGAATVVVSTLQYLTEQAAAAAAAVMQGMWDLFETTTFVDVTTGQFTRVYNIVFGIAVFVMVGFFLLQVTAGMLRREPAALSRAALGLAKSVLGSFVILTLLAAALEITDRLCVGMVAAAGTNLTEIGDRITLLTAGTALTVGTAIGGAPIVALLLACLVGCAALILWFSLLIRKALLLVAIVFAPLALAGASWDATRGWVARWANVVIALIVSKVVIVVFLLLATAQLTAPISTDLATLSDPITGVVLLLVAGFAPYLTYKSISFIGFDMYHAMSAEQEAKHALNRPVPVPTRWLTRGQTPRILDGGPSGAGGSSSPPPPPARTAAGPTAPASSGPVAAGAGTAAGAAKTAGASGAARAGAAGPAGPVAVGALAVTGAASTGLEGGRSLAGKAAQQTDAAQNGQQR